LSHLISDAPLALHADGKDVLIAVFAKPKASRSKVLGVKNGLLEVALAAPPVDGKANSELLHVLGKTLGLPQTRLSIESGLSGRHKRVRVTNLPLEQALVALDLETGV
jgi:uncharacterized protein (TIGR00251 family)